MRKNRHVRFARGERTLKWTRDFNLGKINNCQNLTYQFLHTASSFDMQFNKRYQLFYRVAARRWHGTDKPRVGRIAVDWGEGWQLWRNRLNFYINFLPIGWRLSASCMQRVQVPFMPGRIYSAMGSMRVSAGGGVVAATLVVGGAVGLRARWGSSLPGERGLHHIQHSSGHLTSEHQ